MDSCVVDAEEDLGRTADDCRERVVLGEAGAHRWGGKVVTVNALDKMLERQSTTIVRRCCIVLLPKGVE
jgi:hypothetical protein